MGKNLRMSCWPGFLMPTPSTVLSRNTASFPEVKSVCRRTDRFGLFITLSFYALLAKSIKFALKQKK